MYAIVFITERVSAWDFAPTSREGIAIINLTDGHHRLMQALSKPILHNEYRLEIAEAALERRPRVLRQALNT